MPDGALNYLPFAALLTSEVAIAGQVDFKRLPYLAKRYAISYAQSASVWRELIQAKKGTPSPPKRFLAFADPAYEQRPATASQVAHLRDGEDSVLRSAYDERGQHWKRLPYSGENETRPQFSGIILTTREGSGEDGYLQMYEIFNLRLNARLVVLSGCNTGLGKSTNGEGMVGLTRAFLYAGAESVLASLWKIEDRSTSEFMKAFYGGLEKNTAAQALRAAQLAAINTGNYSHPYYWSAFVLYGGH